MLSLLSENLGYLIDMDGTLISGGKLLPGASWLVERLRDRFVIVSNDAEHTPLQMSEFMLKEGITVAPERIVLAGTIAIEAIADQMPGARVMMLGSPALQNFARSKGLRLATGECDIVLVGRDRQFTYRKLAAAAEAVSSGAALWLACPDINHRGPAGEPVPEAGALGMAIAAVAGVGNYHVVGKPESAIFEIACARLGAQQRNVVVIGDNPATDGEGARRLGMRFIHVRPGDIGPNLFTMDAQGV